MGLFVNVNEASIETANYDSFIECYEENMIEAGANILIEAEQNWNAIMKAVGIEEVKAYSEGTEVITEAGRIGGMLEKAKQFFLNLWKKVVGMFKKMLSLLDQAASKDKDFVKKYRSDIIKIMAKTDWNKDLSMDLYVFKDLGNHTKDAIDNIKSKATSNGFEPQCDVVSIKDPAKINGISWKDEIGDTVRSWSLGENSTETESDFRKEWKEKIYGDKDNTDIEQSIVLDALKEIENTNTANKTLKNVFKPIDDSLKLTIKNLDKAANNVKFKDAEGKDLKDDELKAKTEEYSAIGTCLSVAKACQTTITAVYSMECQAIKDKNRQCRAIVSKVYRRPVKEGFEHFEESAFTGSAFDSIRLV